jgi:sec-independent protein translocase protein TatA
MPFGFSLFDVLLILGLLLLLFGPRRLPLLGQALGKTIREFQRAIREERGPDQTPPAAEKDAAP